MAKNGRREGYTYYCGGDRSYPLTVLKFGSCPPNKRKYHHPTQKPVDLIRYLIRTYSNPGDVVLDNCMGSGSTAIAAIREQRHYIGFELDDYYYEMCMQRIADEENYVEEKKKEPVPNTLF